MAALTDSLLLDLVVLLVTLVGAAYLYSSRNYRHWEKKGIPFMKPLPFVGNFLDVLLGKKNLGDLCETAYNEGKGKLVMGLFAFHRPILVIRDLDIVKSVLVKDFNSFMDRNGTADEESDPMIAKSLSSLDGPRWKHLRSKLTPAFSSGKMKRMFAFVDECGKELVKYTDKYTVDGRIEIKDTMARFTTDVIASCVFGIQGNALQVENSEFRRMLARIFEFSLIKGIKLAVMFTAPALSTALKLKMTDAKVEDYIRNVVWSTVDERKKKGVVRKDFLDLLIQLREKGSVEDDAGNGHVDAAGEKFVLEGDDFVAQAFIFIGAGFETSSTTMTFTLYELALQPDIQTRLRQEIQSVLDKNNGQLTYEGVQEMTYLDMAVQETLRKYPVLPFLDRKVQQPYTIPGTTIQLDKDDSVFISLTGIHHNPEYYPDPYKYDPERFTEENKRSRPNYTHMPFGEGPRGCIGMRIGLLQTKVGLIHLLSQFEVKPCKETPIPLQLDKSSPLLGAKGDLFLVLNRVK